MKYTQALFACLFIAGCSPAGMLSNGPIFDVDVDGIPHKVQHISDNSWAANKANLLAGKVNPKNYERNIRAIEIHTGCVVLSGTVNNRGLNTIALVNCDG
ncbi:MAG: hypothetical protein COA45_03915 [Zetaproteobacteria bacterium]|nr:MAG: hypothetical protein COA45_03915 [Zetaproteobacteria bacterium]